MPQRNLLILLSAIAVSYLFYLQGGQNPYCRYVARGLAAIHEDSLDAVPSNKLFNGAMQGMVDVLRERGDEHSQFLDEAEAGPLRNEIHQQFGGIGVRLGLQGVPPQLVIAGPPDAGTPAATAQLSSGDFILQIDDKSTAGLTAEKAMDLIRGAPGTSVRLSVRHPTESKPHSIELTRDVIHVDSVLGDRRDANGTWIYSLSSDPRVAYIRIVGFGDRTALEFDAAMKQVIAQGAQGIILDLRDNGGGALDAAVAICEMLLPSGKVIVETRGRGQALRQHYETKHDGAYRDLPLAVLVNQNSASASEIVAACLQDHGRATIVGERSFGKGTVQQLVPLESGKSLLKLTWASFRRPSGANIHHAAGAPPDSTWGVSPNPGFERKLTPAEYAAYRAHRTELDDLAQPDTANTTPFSDDQLTLAIKALKRTP